MAGRPKRRKSGRLPGSLSLLLDATRLVAASARLFGGLVAIHITLIILLALDPSAETAALYALLLNVLISMAEIYAVRQLLAGEKPALREALYRGTAQFVPFSLFGVLFSLQLLPLAFGLWLLQVVVLGGIAVGALEQLGFGLLIAGLAALSWYWLAAAIPGFYIVTLGEVRPMEAWHAAKRLVASRRRLVLWRTAVLAVTLGLIGYLLISLLPDSWTADYNVLAAVTALLLPFAHAYSYKLYRSLI